MLVAWSAGVVVGGIFGGSGNHVVQITIGVVVVIALIVYWTLFLTSRRRMRRARAVSADPVPRGAGDGTNDEATLRLSRVWSGIGLGGQSETWDIVLDGKVVGGIADQEIVEVAVAPGHHSLRLGQGRHMSGQRSFDVPDAGTVSYRCHGPRFWPVWLAATIKPDLWISLTAE